MNILFAYPTASLGGAPRVMLEVARHMARHGANVSVVLGAPGPAVAEYAAFANVRTLKVPYRLRRALGLQHRWFVRRWLNRHTAAIQPDLIYVTHVSDPVWLDWAVASTAPVIAHVHGLHLRDFYQSQAILERVSTYADHYICCAEATRRRLVVGMGVPAEKTSTLYNGINLDRSAGRDLAAEVARVRAELNLPPGALLVGAMGTLSYGKGADLFVRVVEAMRRRRPDQPTVGLWLGGQPGKTHFSRSLARYAREHELEDAFRFVGYQTDVFPYLAALDLYCCTTRQDALPLSLMEALSVGTPVVSTPEGGIPELLAPDDGPAIGLLSDGYEPDAIVVAALPLLDDADLRREMGRAGQAHVTAQLDSRVCLPRFRATIEAVAGGRALDA